MTKVYYVNTFILFWDKFDTDLCPGHTVHILMNDFVTLYMYALSNDIALGNTNMPHVSIIKSTCNVRVVSISHGRRE